jgi:pyrimidine operon attenuation protein/uracil phosphoribosyltransferase
LVGIDTKGEIIARKIANLIEQNANRKLIILKAIPDRKNDSTIALQIPALQTSEVTGKTILIVDDVLYSGKTIYYTLEQVMQMNPAKVQAVVLIDRGHRSFPVHADYTGLELGTTLQEHIRVEISPVGEVRAYLFS